jgi:hypothetical protein
VAIECRFETVLAYRAAGAKFLSEVLAFDPVVLALGDFGREK